MNLFFYIISFTFLLIIEPTFSQNIENGLIAHYLLNGSALDVSGHNNNGTIYGAVPAEDRFGNKDSALYFDGINDYIFVPNSPSLNPTDAITISAWYKTTPFIGNGFDGLVNKAYSTHIYPHYQYQLGVGGNEYWNTVSNFGFAVSPNDVSIGVSTISNYYDLYTWYFVLGTYDGNNVRLYVDGKLVDSKPATGKMKDYGSDVYIARHGNQVGGITYYLPGTIDDVRIYNRALSQQEITELFNSTKPVELNFSYQGECVNTPVEFVYTGSIGYDSIRWNFGDNLESIQESPSHAYSSTGDFDVTLNMYYKNQKYSYKRKIDIVAPPIVNLGNDTTLCPGYSIRLDAGDFNGSILWNDGSVQNYLTVNKPGTFSVIGMHTCGMVKDSISIAYGELPNVYIPTDTVICRNTILNISAKGSDTYEYLWNNNLEGKNLQHFSVSNVDINLLVSDQTNCKKEFTTHLVVKECLDEILIPNVITPNGDGANDFWVIEKLDKYPNALIEVFNRWGEQVYKSVGYKYPWDGYFNGKCLTPGCYFLCNYFKYRTGFLLRPINDLLINRGSA